MEENWTTEISPLSGWFDINLKEIWKYRDLAFLFTKRNFTITYKQTILGPVWMLITPLITSLVFTVVFGTIAKIPTDGVPNFLFYMCGNVLWGLFASCINNTANSFTSNAALLGKIYFPRLIMPISSVMSATVNFFIQFSIFVLMLIYFAMNGAVSPNMQYLWLLPLILLQLGCLGLGVGIIISSVTTKYRDLAMIVGFFVQLWMYATPIVYPMSQISGTLGKLILLNPIANTVEMFRFIFLGTGTFTFGAFGFSWLVTLIILAIGAMLFSKVEKTFIDTI
ncbi:MAG: ABC transporter permease [Oscillospiraceae bacterium]